jgi:hypothetical protein
MTKREYRPKVKTVCEQCRSIFYKPYAWYKRDKHHFCCGKCYNFFRMDRVTKHCIVCGDPFQVRPSEKCKFSTCKKVECRRENKRSENNPNWRGGVTTPKKADLTTKKGREWCKAVFERDNYTCQKEGCGVRGVLLHSHHIRPWAWFPDLRYEINNGVTLCKPCHEKTYGDTFKQRPNNAECVATA